MKCISLIENKHIKLWLIFCFVFNIIIKIYGEKIAFIFIFSNKLDLTFDENNKNKMFNENSWACDLCVLFKVYGDNI